MLNLPEFSQPFLPFSRVEMIHLIISFDSGPRGVYKLIHRFFGDSNHSRVGHVFNLKAGNHLIMISFHFSYQTFSKEDELRM